METPAAPSNFVLVCNKIDSSQQEQMNRIELPNFNCTVADLAATIGQQLNLDKDAFDIISFGQILGNTKTLESYGVNKGIIVYLMKKKEAIFKEPAPPQPQETAEGFIATQVQEGCVAVKSALINAHFRKVLDGLADIEKRENLMAINPELRNDPTLFGILTDDTLMNTFIRSQNIMKVLKKYPNFLEVATHVAATFHEESSSSNPFNLDNLGRGALNYSLDYPSDDDMDDSETSSVDSNSTQASGSGVGSGGGRLVGHPTQGFQNLLNAAHQYQQNQRQNAPPGAAGQQQRLQPPTIITPEMLSHALFSATSSSPNPTPSPAAVLQQQQQQNLQQQSQQPGQPASAPESAAPVNPASSSAARIIGWAPQLRQMRELGITDDIVAIQALEATNGDVQAAINIIFS